MIEQITLAHTYGGAHIDNLLEEMLLGGAVPYNNQVSAIWVDFKYTKFNKCWKFPITFALDNRETAPLEQLVAQ